MFEAGPNLHPAAFKALDPAFVQILDVREQVLIPLGELVHRVGELDPNRPLAAYCHHGMRSLQALRFLQGVGFSDLAHLAGGIDAYSRMDPSVPRY